MKLFILLLISILFYSCTFELSNKEIESKLADHGLKLNEEMNLVENRVDITHIDYYETVELQLSDSEYENIKNQITSFKDYCDLNEYQAGFEDFLEKQWTYAEVFGTDHYFKDSIIQDSTVLKIAYYYHKHKCTWVERKSTYGNNLEFFRYCEKMEGHISIIQSRKKLYYSVQDD